ncbi:cell death activator CIDE-3-like isoform X3 [Synchiropus splendidus]|uniref:cell death activator CIDE-3-like isoform X3 n=1 Tax=Synchiropus splendidus TaxID=270530 RepID=UPI00237D3D40|nr:cell death activator CIDE-3-like isoform X3 [Synchiropus splendidus]XP_053725316.1 cell death activator CIDE-3-like isoform X3 [Synchiropus splendidus]XP_053725317.1 cell death activator CIDE-3-like isoform X3 [Synchiropus splendidus]
MGTEYFECHGCREKVAGWSQAVLEQLDRRELPAVLTYRLTGEAPPPLTAPHCTQQVVRSVSAQSVKWVGCRDSSCPAGRPVGLSLGFSRRSRWCVTASMSAANKTQQILSARVARSKPFRVSNAERSVKKGITADSLDDLMNKVKDSLDLISVAALVLDEDGTDVDNEEFFRTLPDNCVLVVLEEGQKWTQQTSTSSRDQLVKWQSEQRTDVAKLTFDLYKNDPRDFIGCLNVKATLYGAYSLSYNLRCHAAKKVLKEALKWTTLSMQATGHILLCSSWYIEQLLDEENGWKSPSLPQGSRMRQLQNLLLGPTSQ